MALGLWQERWSPQDWEWAIQLGEISSRGWELVLLRL